MTVLRQRDIDTFDISSLENDLSLDIQRIGFRNTIKLLELLKTSQNLLSTFPFVHHGTVCRCVSAAPIYDSDNVHGANHGMLDVFMFKFDLMEAH